MNKKLFIGLGIFVVVLIVVFMARNSPTQETVSANEGTINENTIVLNNPNSVSTTTNDDDDDDDEYDDDDMGDAMTSSTQTSTDTTTSTTTTTSSTISMDEFSKHNSKDDCWVIYDGKVYDVTSYIPRHPGGEQRIARNCGTQNFQAQFTNQHGTSKVSLLMNVGTFIGDFDVIGNI